MNTTRLAQARRLFNSPFASREINRSNQRKWARSIRLLGHKWLYARTLDLQTLSLTKTQG